MTRLSLLLSASLIGLTAAPVFAEETGTVFSTNPGVRLSFSGQVNRGVLFADDGEETETFFVDNDNSSTRFRFKAEGDIASNTVAGINIEIEAESNSTAEVSQDRRNVSDVEFLNPRKLEFFIAGDNFGRVTVGMGDTVSNNASEVDLSGTAVVGYSSVEDAAGGIQFRDGAGNLSGTTIGAAFTNLDGLSRQDRLRYDTPSFGGLTLSASAGVAGSGETGDEFYDVAARYKGNFGAVKVDSALAYVQTPNDDEIVNGSVSFLHEDSGLSLTLAGATMEFDDPTDDRDTLFGYVKVGYKTDAITQMGKTAFAIDYAYNEDVLQVGDESTSVGLLAVQNITAINSELYVGVRNYELERPGASFEDVTIILAGARIRF